MAHNRKKLLKFNMSGLKEIADNLNIKIPVGSDRDMVIELLCNLDFEEAVEDEIIRKQKAFAKIKKENLDDFLTTMRIQHMRLIAETLNIAIPYSSSRTDIANLLQNDRNKNQVIKEINKHRIKYVEEYINRNPLQQCIYEQEQKHQTVLHDIPLN